MKCFSFLVMGLGIGILALSSPEVAGQNLKKKTNPTTPSDEGGIFTAPLVASDVLLKLKLTSEQKADCGKLQKEFADKLKEIADKAKKDAADQANAPALKGKGKGKAMPGKGGDAPGVTDALSLRSDYEDKVYDLLNDAQQKIWLDIKTKKGESLLTGGNNSTTTKPKK
jgi:hypothetical protein